MTTARTGAPSASAVAARPSASSRTKAPPKDAFATLLSSQGSSDAKQASARPAARRDRDDDAAAAKHDDRVKAADKDAKDAADATAKPDDPPAAADQPPQQQPPAGNPQPILAILASPLPVQPQAQPAATTPAAAAQAQAQTVVTGQVVATPQRGGPGQAQPNGRPAPGQVQPNAVQPQTPQPDADAAQATPAGATAAATDPSTPIKVDLPPAPVQQVADLKLPTAPAAQPQQPPVAPHSQADADAGSQPQQGDQQPAAHTAAPVADATAAAPAPADATTTSAQPLQPLQPVVTTQNMPSLSHATTLARAPQTIAATIQLSQERGFTRARINLRPVELGGIEVRLHSTPQGVTAHLVADSPEAAKALVQAGDDLRKQLEAKDVNLLSLDVSTSDGGKQQSGFSLGGDATGGDSARSQRTRYGRASDAAEAAEETDATQTLVLPDGVHVDVLA
jgi:flagellar hook-length control protein FliK